jgi:ERF superfamily
VKVAFTLARTMERTVSNIHKSIIEAMRMIAKTGIAKLSKNKDQGYNFRGIEAAMNEMSPILINCGITVTPSYSDLVVYERESKSGGKLRFVTVKGSFKFEADDGSFVTGEAYGEGMDSSDKATAKAMSVAYRTALFQQFVVPTMAIDPDTGYGVPTREEELEDLAHVIVEKFEAGNSWGAYEEYSALEDNDEKLKVWSVLKPHSKLRAALKEHGEAERKKQEELNGKGA